MQTSKKRLLQIAALLLTVFLSASCSLQTVSLPDWVTAVNGTGDDSDWRVADKEETIVLANGGTKLEMQADTTHFVVTDLSGGEQYKSVPDNVDEIYSAETDARIISEISLVYYDKDSTKLVMTSTTDSVLNGNYEIRQKDGATLRVYYTMGVSATLFVPEVLTKEVFEQTIGGSGALSASQIRRLTRYYELYSAADQEAQPDYADQLDRYPVLAEKDLYILKDNVDQMKKTEITEYMSLAEYTAEEYALLLDELKIGQGESEEAGFTIPVEYSLTDDGFTAKILMDKVVEFSPEYPLYQIDLLEYFSSCAEEEEGYYLVPDGCGALIRMNQKEGDYSQKFYGNDAAVQTSSKSQLSKSALLPVFGIARSTSGLIGIVEEGSQTATLHAGTRSASNPQNTIYTSFNVRELDVTDIGIDRNIPVYNLYSKHLLRTSPQVRYVLLEQSKADYVDMAAYIRQYYLANGKLPGTRPGSSIFLDYACIASQDTTFLGIPYTYGILLSTLEDITGQLSASGLEDVSVRLSGYSDEGITHRINNAFNLSRKVGTTDQLLDLGRYLQGQNGRLYLEADFQRVYKDRLTDRFSVKADTAQYLNRSLVIDKAYDRVTRAYYDSTLSSYLLSPTQYPLVAGSFLDSLENVFGADSGLGISYASAGSLLPGDYGKRKDLDRTATVRWIEEALSSAHESTAAVVTEAGNGYVLPYVDQLVNVPLISSEFEITSESVPFYQLVVHGSVGYTGTAMNLSADPGTNLLRSLEYGAGLYWELMVGEDYLFSGTAYETALYSMNADKNLENAVELYKQLGDYFKKINGVAMTGHEKLAGQVYRTTYGNGSWVIVNYGGEDVVVDGVSVAGRGYVLWY
ncbi:MAG: DUF5696 domain-containing protein [Saccharofermentanales bacterium]